MPRDFFRNLFLDQEHTEFLGCGLQAREKLGLEVLGGNSMGVGTNIEGGDHVAVGGLDGYGQGT